MGEYQASQLRLNLMCTVQYVAEYDGAVGVGYRPKYLAAMSKSQLDYSLIKFKNIYVD